MGDIVDWLSIENDEFFKRFLNDDAKQSNVTQVLSVAQQLRKLGQAIAVLDTELQKQVLANHEDLLSQATWVEKLEDVLSIMQVHVQSLLSAVERLRGKIVEPFNRIETQTTMLSRLHESSDLLRRVSRMQHLSRRLHSQMNNGSSSPDIVKAANSLHELEQLMSDTDLSGLDVVADDRQAVKVHRSTVQRIATHTLTQGLQSTDRSQVGTAVQVFANLGALRGAVDSTVTSALSEVERVARESLDVTLPTSQDIKRGGPGRATLPSPGSSGNLRSKLWANLERLFQDSVYTRCIQIELLQRILLECHARGFDDLSERFWSEITKLLAQVLLERSQASSFVKQALEGEYPKFLRIYLDLGKRLKERPQAIGSYAINRNVISSFENPYLSRSVSRLLDPVHTMFSGDVSPGQDDIDSLVRTVASELSVSLVDEGLSTVVARNVGKAIRLFCLKCEQALITGGEASQVIDSPTAGQQANVILANLLHYLSTQTSRVLGNLAGSLPVEGASIVATALEEIDVVTKNILTPLLASVNDAIESIILTMHDDPEFRETTSPLGNKDIGCSLYMRELQGFILRSVNTFLAPYKNQRVVAECCKSVVSRCIELFVRHACLLRPLTDYGRAKLIADFVQMEVAVAPLCRGGQLGSNEQQQYRTLRALRSILALSPEDMVEKVLEGEGEGGVPASLVLLHLFSGAPVDLPSPHQSAGWSVSRLSHWMDNHTSERERLALSSGPLQRYQTLVRHKNLPSFHPLFPLMTKLASLGDR